MFLRHVQENPRPVHIWPGRFSYLHQNGQRDREMEVVAGIFAEGRDILVREHFGGAQIGAVRHFTEAGEEPCEVAGFDRFTECDAKTFA